jgi:hypothetical protein
MDIGIRIAVTRTTRCEEVDRMTLSPQLLDKKIDADADTVENR